jgi:predicted DNA-binding mobile mystery protein A
MHIHRAVTRRRLDIQLIGVSERVGPFPPHGWIRTIRRAIGMSGFELASRMGLSQPRVSQLERAEVTGSIGLSTLRRVAVALECQLVYAFVPAEPLEQMVFRQARTQAIEELGSSPNGVHPHDEELARELHEEKLSARAHELVDSHRLWRTSKATRPASAPPFTPGTPQSGSSAADEP